MDPVVVLVGELLLEGELLPEPVRVPVTLGVIRPVGDTLGDTVFVLEGVVVTLAVFVGDLVSTAVTEADTVAVEVTV
jgi:hypothetical protein